MQPLLDSFYQTVEPHIQYGYQYAQPYVQNYTTARISPDIMTSSLVATLAGHAVTRLMGDTVGFTSSMALAYAGAEMMHTESTKALLLAAGFQILPSVIKRVASDVLSGTILGAGGLAVRTVVATGKYTFDVLTGASRAESEAVKNLKEKIKELKQEKAKLKSEKIGLVAKIALLENQQKAKEPKEVSEPSKE